MLSPAQQKKLLRLGKVLDGGAVAVLSELEAAEGQIEALQAKVEAVENAIPELRQAKDGDKGDTGERGEKGDKGDRGEKGEKGDAGRDGKDGKNGKDGRDGVDGKDGRDGKDGFVDVATVAYLEDKIETVHQLAKSTTKINSKHSDGIGLIVRELRAGTGVTIDNSNQEYPIINAIVGDSTGGTLLNTDTLLNKNAVAHAVLDDDVAYHTIEGSVGDYIKKTKDKASLAASLSA